jgi:hypothetical protein
MVVGIALTGCSVRPQSELVGTWIGTPHRAADDDSVANGDSIPTDWQNYDVTVQLRLLADGSAEWRLNGDDFVPARWRVIDSGPGSAVLEMETTARAAASPIGMPATDAPSPSPASPSPAASAPPVGGPDESGGDGKVRRRFELLLHYDDDRVLEGFMLWEVGADRQLGAVEFRRGT